MGHAGNIGVRISCLHSFPTFHPRHYIPQRPIFERKLEIKTANKTATHLTAESSPLYRPPYIMSGRGKMMNAFG